MNSNKTFGYVIAICKKDTRIGFIRIGNELTEDLAKAFVFSERDATRRFELMSLSEVCAQLSQSPTIAEQVKSIPLKDILPMFKILELGLI